MTLFGPDRWKMRLSFSKSGAQPADGLGLLAELLMPGIPTSQFSLITDDEDHLL